MQLIFYKSKEHKNYYLIYKGPNKVDPQYWLEKLTHTGEHTESGYGHLEIEIGFTLQTEAHDSFVDFLVEHVATNHIDNPDYDISTFRSWYEFTDIKNTEKWLADFYEFQKQKRQELQKANGDGMQTALF